MYWEKTKRPNTLANKFKKKPQENLRFFYLIGD